LAAQSVDNEQLRVQKLKKIEEAYWYRRLINADYYKQIKKMIKDGTYM